MRLPHCRFNALRRRVLYTLKKLSISHETSSRGGQLPSNFSGVCHSKYSYLVEICWKTKNDVLNCSTLDYSELYCGKTVFSSTVKVILHNFETTASSFYLLRHLKLPVKVGHSRTLLLSRTCFFASIKHIRSFQRFRRARTYLEVFLIDKEALPTSKFLFPKVFLTILCICRYTLVLLRRLWSLTTNLLLM